MPDGRIHVSGNRLAWSLALLLGASGLAVLPAPVAAPAAPAAAKPACVAEQPDERAAVRMTGFCGKPVEILSERSEVSQTFANPDGSRTLEESIEPVRVRRGSSWVPVDTTLKAKDGVVAPRATALPVTFSAGGTGPLARLRDAGRELSISWPDELPAPQLRGDTAVYRDVLPDVDLQMTAQSLGFSELLVVRSPAGAANPRLAKLRFEMAAQGVVVAPAAGGGLVARDRAGKTVFTAPAPLMWDSSIEEAATDQPDSKAAPKVTPKDKAQSRTTAAAGRRVVMPVGVTSDSLTLQPDRNMLADPGTKFPVYIDPSWTGSVSGSSWTLVMSKLKTSSFWKNSSALTDGKTYGSAGAGRTEDCSGCSDYTVRSMFRMDTSKVSGKQILGATFRIEQRHSWTCSPKSNAKLWLTGSISSSTTWNNQPAWYGDYTAQTSANRKNGSIHGCSGVGTVEFNAKSMVTKAAGAKWSTMTVGLRAVDEGTKNQWKRFNHSSPKLAITYNTAPSAPSERYSDAKGCATGASRPYVRTLTPTLAAKQSDPDSDQDLTTSFYWWQSGSARSESNKVSQSAGNKTSVSKAIPSGKLTDDRVYGWQARTADAHLTGGFSATCEFAVDVTAPSTPSSVVSSAYPASTPDMPGSGGVGVSGSFTIAAPTSGADDLAGYSWTLDTGLQASAARQISAAPGQSVSFDSAPVRDGVNTLRVWAKDKAGWYSATPFTYTFKVSPGSGPAANWTFDEASGAPQDEAGHANTLALGAAGARMPGRGGVGSALNLNGTAASTATLTGPVMTVHPTTGVATPVRTDSSFTVTAWVKLTSLVGQPTIVSMYGSRTNALTLGYSSTSARWQFVMAGSDVDAPTLYTVPSNTAPVAGKWTHLAGTYDIATHKMTLYVNGVAQTGTATVTGGFNATVAWSVGKGRSKGVDNDGLFTGAVDDVRFYSYAETAAKLAVLALPMPAAVTLPGGDTVALGATASVVIGSGDDNNITSYKYSIGTTALDQTATPAAPGASVTIPLVTTAAGAVTVYAVAVDGSGKQSPTTSVAQLTVLAPATLSGFVTDGDFNPLPGASVRLEPGGRTATAGGDGSYTLTGFAAGTYTVTGTFGGVCGLTAVAAEVMIDGEAYLDLMLLPVSDGLGYTCDTRAAAFSPADQTVLALTGDNAVTTVPLPFAFPFYGQAFRSAWVDTNGLLSFTDPAGSHPYDGGTLPSTVNPNPMVAPFWDDFVVDASASVRTAASGSGTAATFAIEWRNVQRKAVSTERLSFQVVLAADGTVTTNYTGLDTAAEKGANAAVGIASPAGEDGLTYSRNEAVLADGQAVVFDYPEPESPIAVHDLSGTLINAAGTPVVGTAVTLDPSGLSTTTGAGGAWHFDDLVADSYLVSSTQAGRCPAVARAQVELASDTTQELKLGPDYGGLGYACTVGTATFVSADTVLALTGDDATKSVTMPFPIALHGRSYTSGYIHTNGLISFGDQVGTNTYVNPTMPTAAAPNAVIAPFWDDLEVDASASVRTQVQGTAPNRSFVVEWRNVNVHPNAADRVTFEAILYEDGRIAYQYGTLDTPVEQGAAATVGVENASGTVAALYSFQQAVLTSNSSITYTPAAAGTVGGSVTVAVTGTPMTGTTVTLNPGGRTTITGADGTYQFTGLPVGEYTIAANTGDNRCGGQYAKETVNFPGGTADVDLSLMVDGDEFGYKCDSGARTFIPGDVAEGWTGDETVWQKNPPFPIKLYGESYTSAWISANGLVSFKDPMYFGWIGSIPSALPSPAVSGSPNATVYVHWDDWVVDSQSRIATKTSGTAPNRQWVVEWRNVYLYGDVNARASFEAIFNENGEVTLAYADITATDSVERGSGATVGIENASGTIGFQYLYREALLASGQGVTFRPNPPGNGAVSGTVSCDGAAVEGATVSVAGSSATTGADGTYRIQNIPAGSYAVVATRATGACRGSSVDQAVVGTNTDSEASFPATATAAGAGYTLAEQTVGYTPADGSVLAITGDDAYTSVTLPFPITLYGQTYGTGYVDTNGLVAFVDPGESSSDAWPIPSPDSPEEPNAAVYPFWHDWVVDADASVRTATRGTAPNRQYVVEWRNVASLEDPNTRVTFQAIFDEAGGYSFAYPDLDGTFITRGGAATIGIENADGTTALQYTYRQPVLRPGLGLRFNPPAA